MKHRLFRKIEGKIANARLTILIGCIRGYNADVVADLSQLPINDIGLLRQGFARIKKAWKKKDMDIAALVDQTQLSEEEVKYVLTCLDTPTA